MEIQICCTDTNYKENKMHERKYTINEDGKLVRRVDGVPVPDDEPLFILRAQDKNTLPVLLAYHIICQDLSHKANVVKSIKDFQTFQNKHPERMKEPDTD